MIHRWIQKMWWLFGVFGLFAVLIPLQANPSLVDPTGLVIGCLFIAFLANLPFPIGSDSIDLTHGVSLSLALIFGVATGSLALLLGFALGFLIRSAIEWGRRGEDSVREGMRTFRATTISFGRQSVSLFLAFLAFTIAGGIPLAAPQDPAIQPLSIFWFGTAFGISFALFFLLGSLVMGYNQPSARYMIFLLVAVLVPVPLAVLTSIAYTVAGLPAILLSGALLSLVTPTMREMSYAEQDLERRLDELSTISRVSQAMRTSLDLESILTTIYLQVSHLLDVNSFYLALFDPDLNQLSYPIAIKDGIKQNWLSRPVTDRLTDRVIQTSAPLLIPEDASYRLRKLGFNELNNPPEAWLGVPLISPERAIGCLAVFHTEPGRPLTLKDQEILLTVAAQAAIAIENALLFDQTKRRAEALSSLNKITNSMSASLDPDRTLELVSQSMTEVGGAQKSAIYLLDQVDESLVLARGANISNRLENSIGKISLDDKIRTRAVHDRTTVEIPSIETSDQPEDYVRLLIRENIHASIELPLIAPAGTIGLACVYFDSPQHFRHDQLRLLETLAAQAALSVANARAHAETDQELRLRLDQLSTIEAIGRKIVSTLEAAELFQIILDQALLLANSETGNLTVFEPNHQQLRIVAQRGYTGERMIADDQLVPVSKSRWLIEASDSLQSIRVDEKEILASENGWLGEETRSALLVPVVRSGENLGVLTIESNDPSHFSQHHMESLNQLSTQAAVAMTNAALYEQLEDRLQEQSLLYKASASLASQFEAESIAAASVESLANATHASSVHFFRWWDRTRSLELFRSSKLSDEDQLIPTHIAMEDVPSFASALKSGEPIQWTASGSPSMPDREFLQQVDSSAVLAIPLRSGETTIGMAVVLKHDDETYDPNVVQTSQTIAAQASVAYQNAALFVDLRRNHERLLSVLNSTDEGMAMVDSSGTVVLANEKLVELTGLELEFLVGEKITQNDFEIAAKLGYRPAELANLLAALRSRDAVASDGRVIEVQEPTHRYLHRIEAPVLDGENQPIGWLLVLRDVSNERELEVAREQLTQMIVHDLRSPLTTILTSLSLMESSLPEDVPPLFNQALSVSNRSCQQMLGLVNSLLDIAKLQSDEFDLDVAKFSIVDLCKDLVDLYVPEANELGIILNEALDDDLPGLEGDEDKLRRVVDNVLDNALKFTPTGGEISLEGQASDADILLSISDTGPGVPDQAKNSIFERFVQGESNRKGGTGLGLAFSKLAVEAHGGQIWVEDRLGGGSIFKIRLPLKPSGT